MPIVDLALHPYAYVTTAELARYWRLPHGAVLDYVRHGTLEAINLGPGIYRIRTQTALDFEQRSVVRAEPRPAARVTQLRRNGGDEQEHVPEWAGERRQATQK